MDPDILLIDEALSVGDVQFQKKCITRMEEHQSRGVTIFFVSHAVEQIKRFCEKAIWIDGGQIRQIGPSALVADRYYDFLHMDREEKAAQESSFITPKGTPARILDFRFESTPQKTFDHLEVTLEYEVLEEQVDKILAGVAIYDRERRYIFGANTHLDGLSIPDRRGVHRVRYKIPSLPLLPGTYSLDAGIFTNKGIETLDYRIKALSFEVRSDYFSEGLVHLEHEWIVNG